MKKIDLFLFNDLKKVFDVAEVGFFIDDICAYDKALASIRMRCYDIISYFNSIGVKAELYKPFKKYNVVIFTKTKSNNAVKTAKKLRKTGTKIIFDAYCEFIDDEENIDSERINILQILKYSDYIITCSQVQKNSFSKYHDKVVCIPESVNDIFFKYKKTHELKDCTTLVYCGYSKKAADTLFIRDVLKNMSINYNCRLLYICEEDPKLEGIEYDYLKYQQSIIPLQLLQGDIMIAPRNTLGIEKLSHSFTKVAYPLAVGLPTVASPVPSYIGTPVIICNSEHDWDVELTKLVKDSTYRNEISEKGRSYVKQFFSLAVIGDQYKKIVEGILSEP